MEPTATHRPRYRSAALLGGGLAVSSTAVAGLLLWWSLSGLASAHSEDLPVHEATVLLTGLTTGLVAAALAYTVGSGTVVLVAMASGGGRASRKATPWAARSAAVLLVLVMGTPGAHADASATSGHPHADTAMGAPPVVAEQEERLPVAATLREPDDRDTFDLHLSTGPRSRPPTVHPIPQPSTPPGVAVHPRGGRWRRWGKGRVHRGGRHTWRHAVEHRGR